MLIWIWISMQIAKMSEIRVILQKGYNYCIITLHELLNARFKKHIFMLEKIMLMWQTLNSYNCKGAFTHSGFRIEFLCHRAVSSAPSVSSCCFHCEEEGAHFGFSFWDRRHWRRCSRWTGKLVVHDTLCWREQQGALNSRLAQDCIRLQLVVR